MASLRHCMDFFTHLVFGGLIYNLIFGRFTFDYAYLAVFFVILPDFDVTFGLFRKYLKSDYFEHRGGSHSYITGIIVSAVFNIFYSLITGKSFVISWIIGSLFYALHVSMDMMTTTKIPFLYPLSKKEVCFSVEKAGSSFTFLISFIILIILRPVTLYFYNSSGFRLAVAIVTYFYLFYYLYRVFSKIKISTGLNNEKKYLPGVFPFSYFLYYYAENETSISMTLERVLHGKKNEVLIERELILTPEELDLYHLCCAICKKTYYYSKWTILPEFTKNEGLFSVRFYFLETMMYGNAMYLQYTFDLENKILIRHTQNRSRILNKKTERKKINFDNYSINN